jgi:adenine/guanine phosphoribosyltransferase-like PRPP-binding protein
MDLPIDLKNHIRPDQRVPVVDDLIATGVATGGTTEAAINLISQRGDTVVGSTYIIELSCSNGRDRVPVPVTAMASYDFQSQAAPEPAALATIA